MKKSLLSFLLLLLLAALPALAEGTDEDWSLMDVDEWVIFADDGVEVYTTPEESPVVNAAREDFIDRIIENGRQLYEKANGRAQRAQYAGDIYICKNFTTYLFRQNRDDFRMAAYPDVTLIIPDNLPADECTPYRYGFLWKDIPASEGNPFEVAAQFIYNADLSKDENMALAIEFMKQVKRGDFFQMSADYEYGVGAHSAIMISDYDPETNTVHWMDSNMLGTKKNGERYGYVQFDAEKDITWWAEAFCVRRRGATLYRLRNDIVYASDMQ